MLAVVLLAAAPAPALAAAPAVSTQPATRVTATSAQLNATVNPHGSATTYSFQYGTTTNYTGRTAVRPVGSGSTAVNVAATITGLAPGTKYHFRVVSHNASGTVGGADRAFTTLRIPLRATLTANPTLVTFGFGTILGGRLTGTGSGRHQVVLQQRAFPFTGSWVAAGRATTTDAAGDFRFAALIPPAVTQFRVMAPDKPAGFSGIVRVGVAARIHTRLSARHVTRGRFVRFTGTVTPAREGVRYAIQRRRNGRWVTLAGGLTVHQDATSSAFDKRIRITRAGLYRVYVQIGDGAILSAAGVPKRIGLR